MKRTADHLKDDPEVVVSVTRFSEKLVYVGGEVARRWAKRALGRG